MRRRNVSRHDNINWLQPVNWDHSLNQGLMMWLLALPNQPGWGSSQWLDLCDPVHGHHGTLTNMTPSTAWQASSRPGGWGALAFDGVNDLVSLPAGEWCDFRSQFFYVSAWVNTAITSTRQVIVGRWEFGTGDFRRWLLEIQANGTLRFGASTNGQDLGAQYVSTSTTISPNAWVHVIGMWTATGGSSNDLQIYLNGRRNGSLLSFTGLPADSTRKVAIGIMQPDTMATLPFSGHISDVRIGLLGSFASHPEFFADNLYNLSRQHYPGLLNRVELPWYAAAPAGGFIDNTSPILRHVMGAC